MCSTVADDIGTHRIGLAGRVVSAQQTAQVNKIYSVATHLDQNQACVEIVYSYKNTECCKVLKARLEEEREARTCKLKPPMAKAKAKTNKAKAKAKVKVMTSKAKTKAKTNKAKAKALTNKTKAFVNCP